MMMKRLITTILLTYALVIPAMGQGKPKTTITIKNILLPMPPDDWKENKAKKVQLQEKDPYIRAVYDCLNQACLGPATVTYREEYDLVGDSLKKYESFNNTPQDDGTGTLVSVEENNEKYMLLKLIDPKQNKLSLMIIIKKPPVKSLTVQYDYNNQQTNEGVYNYHIGIIRGVLSQL